MPASLPTQAEALALHQRLLRDDPVAWNDVAWAYLDHLIAWLAPRNLSVPEDLRVTAAEDAVMSLCKRPASYDPARGELFPFLCMAAQRDLQNLLQKEKRHQGAVSLESVEQSPQAGKYLGKEDDSCLKLYREDDPNDGHDPLIAAFLASASAEERRVLELMLDGERDSSVFAAALGLGDLPVQEQRLRVKQLKDRIKARLRRERRSS